LGGVIIIGTGGFAIELAGLLLDLNIKVHGFIGPKPLRKLPEKWLGDDEVIEKISSKFRFLIAIGNPEIRSNLAQKLKQKKLQQKTFVHPKSCISSKSSIALGSIIYPNVTIHKGVVLGDNVLVNSNATIGHETTVDEFSNIGPGASIGGCCKIGREVYIGIGASIIENIVISDQTLIGAGAVVIFDTKSKGTYVGVPAKKIVK